MARTKDLATCPGDARPYALHGSLMFAHHMKVMMSQFNKQGFRVFAYIGLVALGTFIFIQTQSLLFPLYQLTFGAVLYAALICSFLFHFYSEFTRSYLISLGLVATLILFIVVTYAIGYVSYKLLRMRYRHKISMLCVIFAAGLSFPILYTDSVPNQFRSKAYERTGDELLRAKTISLAEENYRLALNESFDIVDRLFQPINDSPCYWSWMWIHYYINRCQFHKARLACKWGYASDPNSIKSLSEEIQTQEQRRGFKPSVEDRTNDQMLAKLFGT